MLEIYSNSDKLRKRLLKEQIKEYKCECCNNSLWLNQKIPLELHHINGDKHDNRAELVYAPFLNSGVQQNLWVRFPLTLLF